MPTHLLRQRRHHAARSARARRRCSRILTAVFGNPSSLHSGRAAGPRGRRAGPRQVAGLARRPAERDRLHRQRHRGRQPGPQRRVGPPGRGRTIIVTSAIEHPAVLELAAHWKRLGVEVTIAAGRRRGLVDPGRSGAKRLRPTNAAGVDHGGQQRDRHAPADCRMAASPAPRRAVSHRCGAGRAARCRSTCARSRSTCSRFPPTSCTGRKASARLYVRKGVNSGRYARRRARNAACARRRRTWPASSGWARGGNRRGGHGRRGRPAGRLPRPPHRRTSCDACPHAYLIGHR